MFPRGLEQKAVLVYIGQPVAGGATVYRRLYIYMRMLCPAFKKDQESNIKFVKQSVLGP